METKFCRIKWSFKDVTVDNIERWNEIESGVFCTKLGDNATVRWMLRLACSMRTRTIDLNFKMKAVGLEGRPGFPVILNAYLKSSGQIWQFENQANSFEDSPDFAAEKCFMWEEVISVDDFLAKLIDSDNSVTFDLVVS